MATGDATQRPALDDAERLARLRLIRTDHVGPILFRDLLEHFGSARAALEAVPDLARRGGRARALKVPSIDAAEAEFARAAAFGARFVAAGEPDYPKHLATLDAPPPLLAAKGGGAVLASDAVAIVGARNCSAGGARFAGRIAADLAASGYVTVSGLARGIDAAAHRATLETGTIAVFAGGLDRIYPPEHDRLVDEILDQDGAIVSEMPFALSPRGRDFPRRNRIVSGISLGVVVIEAARRSGTLHTARFGLEQNREIFAAPGSPLDPRSEGCNRLIRQGAHLVTEAAHVSDVLAPITGRAVRPEPTRPTAAPAETTLPEPLSGDRERVLSALGAAPTAIDEIVRFTGLPARTVQFILLELDLAGRIERQQNQAVALLPGA